MGGDPAGGRHRSSGMPAAPGVQLDPEVMAGVLGANTRITNQCTTPTPTNANGTTCATALGGRGATITISTTASLELFKGDNAGNAVKTRQPFDAYVAIDFEATCERDRRIHDPEIIEFPLVVIDPDQLRVVAEFQRYVRPTHRPQLSDFCTELTGIDQATVDKADTFPVVFGEVRRYMLETLGLGDAPPARSYCVITCGDWDLKTMLPTQCRTTSGVDLPAGLKRWCNLKRFVKNLQPPLKPPKGKVGPAERGSGTGDMPGLLAAVGLTLEGRHHSGIDDCRNIARVALELMRRGYEVRPTLTLGEADSYSGGKGKTSTSTAVGSIPMWRADPSAAHLPSWDSVCSDLSSFSPPSSTAREQAPAGTRGHRGHRGRGPPESGPSEGAPAAVATGAAVQRLPAVVPDTARDAVAETLATAAGGANRTLAPPEMKSISKAISFILRHGADKVGVPVTVNGYARLTDLLAQSLLRSRHVTAAHVAQIVAANDKQRFRMVYDARTGSGGKELYIAATQGHSLEGVEPDLRAITSVNEAPKVIVHGTYWDAFHAIRSCGYLSVMGRHHIHFAKGMPKDADVISGMRANAQVVLHLNVPKCIEDGVPLFESANGVILTPGVASEGRLPITYISKAVDRCKGIILSLTDE